MQSRLNKKQQIWLREKGFDTMDTLTWCRRHYGEYTDIIHRSKRGWCWHSSKHGKRVGGMTQLLSPDHAYAAAEVENWGRE